MTSANSKTRLGNIPLTIRVLLFVALVIGISLSVSSVLIINSVRHHFAEQDASALARVAGTISQGLMNGTINPSAPQLSAPAYSQAGVLVHVETLSGQVIYHSGKEAFIPEDMTATLTNAISQNTLSLWQSNGATYRGATLPVSSEQGEFQVTVAMDMDFHLHFLTEFRNSLWWILMTTGATTLLAAWFGIQQGLMPLRKLIAKIRLVQTSQLHVRLDPDDVPVELRELVHSFNDMVGRLEDGFDRLSHFSSDIAHELRTPLTNLITQTQVTLSNPRQGEEYKELLYSSLEELERMAKMIGDMLWLAKSDNQQLKLNIQRVDLNNETEELTDFFSPMAQDKNISIAIEGKPIYIQADRELLRRAISNLLSNAIRYTHENGDINIKLKDTAGTQSVSISISNTGKEIAKEHQDRIFDRFYRAEPARERHADSTGLGLAIVKSIIQQHDGQIFIHSENGWTTFTIQLPKSITG